MMKRLIAVPLTLAAVAFVAPAAADAATLAPTKTCYGGGDKLILVGGGYTPGGQVTLSASGTALAPPLTAGALGTPQAGLIAGSVGVPFLTSATTRFDTFTATDATNPALTASTSVKRSIVRVIVKPANASPYKTRRFSARGFTAGTTLYRHTVRGKRVSTLRQGKLKTACKTLSFRKRLFRKTAKTGTYTVQFDTQRKYSSKTLQRVRFRVKVYRVVHKASAASAATAAGTHESWTQIK
jgi:hypothetical protein